MNFNITAYSTALFSTWFFIDELGILFDAGDGVTAGLMQKSRRVKHIFISHADRDHLTGLVQFNQLNAREGLPVIYYPKDCGSFPFLADFTKRFDPHVKGAAWNPVKEFDKIEINKGIYVEAIRNNHVVADADVSKSLSFKVWKTKRKLKKEFLPLSGKEIGQIIKEKGEIFATDEVKENLITYSGDTPVDGYEKWNNSNILIHEATFLGGKDERIPEKAGNKHSTLEEVIEMVSGINIGTLILSHFSSRYSKDQIDERIKVLCKKNKIDIPVYRILPGQIHRDILNEKPLNVEIDSRKK